MISRDSPNPGFSTRDRTVDGESVAPLSAPNSIGAFRVLDELGHGGMGVVYRARQESPERLVAIKVMRGASPNAVRRFELESTFLARLQHPGIAQIFEAGTTIIDGRRTPYLAMEYVEGETLIRVVRPRSLDERLALVAEICDAVHHAHQKGVIHRDIKPSNIIVTAEGQPKVLDFGVARAIEQDDASCTIDGQVVGTIPYMSPEQVEGRSADIDIRTDVYSLGVVMYQMLAGCMPYELHGKSIIEAARIIREHVPAPLGRMDRRMRGEVECIVEKAMRKEPERRYQSAADLASDIRRFLNDVPIEARPPSRVYAVRKFCRRNRGAVGVASIALLLVVGLSIGATRQAFIATQQKHLAMREATSARTVNEFMRTMLATADPEMALGPDAKISDALIQAEADVERAFEGMPRERALVHATLSSTWKGIGMLERAASHAMEAREITLEAFGEDDIETISATRTLANMYTELGRLDEARDMTETSLVRLERSLGRRHPETAMALGELARIDYETGRLQQARDKFEEAVTRCREVLDPDDVTLLIMLNNYGSLLKDMGDLDEAERILRDVMERRAARFGEDHPQTAFAMNNLAGVLHRMERNDEAIDLLRRTATIRRERLGEDHPATQNAIAGLGAALMTAGRYEEAEPMIRSSLDYNTRVLGPNHRKTLIGMNNLAYMLEDLGRLDEAESVLRDLVERVRTTAGTQDPETWSSMNNLAMLLHKRGRPQEACGLYEELLGLCEGVIPDDHYILAIFRNNHGDCLIDVGRLRDARRELEASHAVILAFFGEDHVRTEKSRQRLERLPER